MICGMTWYQIFWYFLIYSFGGWLLEVVYQAVTKGLVINRGFLNGPVCPIYGFGVLSVFAAINSMPSAGGEQSDLEIFIFGVVLATAVELFGGWILDKCFHARWWDYSKKPLNLNGYICLEFSLIWGLAILLVVRCFQKYVEHSPFSNTETRWGWILLGILYAVYAADCIVTVLVIRGFNKKLKQLDEVQANMRVVSDKLSSQVGTRTLEAAQRVDESKVQAALAKAELRDAMDEKREELADAMADMKAELAESVEEMREELAESREEFKDALVERREERMEELRQRREALQREYEDLVAAFAPRKHVGSRHLLRAFPNMKHRNYQDIVQQLREKIK